MNKGTSVLTAPSSPTSIDCDHIQHIEVDEWRTDLWWLLAEAGVFERSTETPDANLSFDHGDLVA